MVSYIVKTMVITLSSTPSFYAAFELRKFSMQPYECWYKLRLLAATRKHALPLYFSVSFFQNQKRRNVKWNLWIFFSVPLLIQNEKFHFISVNIVSNLSNHFQILNFPYKWTDQYTNKRSNNRKKKFFFQPALLLYKSRITFNFY